MKLQKNKPFGKKKQIAYTSLAHKTMACLPDTDTGCKTVYLCVEGTDGYIYTIGLTYDDIANLDQALS